MISKKIKECRLELGLTQKELAEKIGSTSKNIWAYENNVSTPPIDILINLSNFFGYSIDYLVGRENDFGNITIQSDSPQLTDSERELLENFRALSPYLQGIAAETLRNWAGKPAQKSESTTKRA